MDRTRFCFQILSSDLRGTTKMEFCCSTSWNAGIGEMGANYNRSLKGNMWSAIPVALLCLIVNCSEGKQGSGPEGDEVLLNTGGLSFVLTEEVDETL